MAELSVPYAQRKLARPSAGGGGGGGLRAVGQPTVPDVSKSYAPLQKIGAEFEDITSELGRVAAQRQKARDVATLTEFESGINEALGVKAEDIKADQRVHPDDYYDTMVAERQKIIDERLQDMPGRLQGIAKGKAIGGTERLMIGMKAEGEKRALERYTNAYDLFMDQQERDYLNTTDPKARDEIGVKMREKTVEYIQAGTFSPDQAAIKLRDARDKIEYGGMELFAQQDPKGFLKEAEQGALNNLPADKRVKLIDKAQSERREQAEWQDHQDRAAEKQVAIQQSERSSQLRDRVYAAGGGPASVRLISEARANREISEGDHAALTSFAIHLQTSRESQAAARASRLQADASRAEMAQRRKDENTVGMLVAKNNAGVPDADGQLITNEGILGMLAKGTITGSVAGPASEQITAHQRRLVAEGNTAKRQAWDLHKDSAQALFEINISSGATVNRQGDIDTAWGAFLNRYNEAVWTENMDPKTAMETYVPQYLAMATGLLTKRIKVVNGAMPEAYQAPPEQGYAGLEAAKQKLKEDWDQLRPDEARFYAKSLKEFESYAKYKAPAPKPKAAEPLTLEPEATMTPATPTYGQRVRQQTEGALGPTLTGAARWLIPQLNPEGR